MLLLERQAEILNFHLVRRVLNPRVRPPRVVFGDGKGVIRMGPKHDTTAGEDDLGRPNRGRRLKYLTAAADVDVVSPPVVVDGLQQKGEVGDAADSFGSE